MNEPSLAYLSLYVADVQASRRFYEERLGLSVIASHDWGVVVDAGSVRLMLQPRDSSRPAQHVEMTFDVDDADMVVSGLEEAGVAVIERVTDRSWGDRDGAVSDPDGNVVYLRTASP